MFDIDLGPAITALFFIFVIIPAFVGMVIGSIVGKKIDTKKNTKKKRYIFAILGMIVLPILWTGFIYYQNEYIEDLNDRNLQTYKQEIVENYKITSFEITENNIKLGVEVPRDGIYDIYVYGYSENEDFLLNRMNSQDYLLAAGNTTIEIPFMHTERSDDFIVKIQNDDINYNFRVKNSLYRMNSTTKPMYEGIVFHSSQIGKAICSGYSFRDLPCVPNDTLHVESN